MQETIGYDDAQYAYDLVRTICKKVGPGLPGSMQERERAYIIKKELESQLGTENVVTEEFKVAPNAFVASIPVSGLLMLIAAILNFYGAHPTFLNIWVTTIGALTFAIFSELVITFEFLFYYEFIDKFFRKKQSVNVIGTLRKPGTSNIKRLLILGGHHDSAQENRWFRFFGYAFYIPSITLFLGINIVLVMSILQITGLISANPGIMHAGTLGWKLLVYPVVPAFLFSIFFTGGRKNGGVVPGAVDNLSACASLVSMCRFLVKNPYYIPEDTEIRFISFGSEEAGLRGSRRYVDRHLKELRRLDCRLLNFETIAHPEIAIMSSDINGRVKNSPEMVETVVTAAKRAGVPYKVKPYPFGGSDAASFSKEGLKATTLLPFKTPKQLVAFYHQRWDRPEILTREPLLNVLKLTFEWICKDGE
jgi:hypothetical protein